MKFFLILTTLLSLNFILTAQTYYSFPTDSAVWSVEEFYWNPNYPIDPNGCIARHYGMVGDTTINGLVYSKLYGNNLFADFPYSDTAFHLPTATYVAAVREDSSKRVWVRRAADTLEYLYYDFSLQVGDTFCFDFFGVGCHPVQWVDSVLVGGAYRRRINFMPTNQESWVEGLGSETGWFEWQYIGTSSWRLLCYTEAGNQLYGGNDCHCDTYEAIGNGVSDALEKEQIRLYPNPVTRFLTIDWGEAQARSWRIEIYAATGTQVLSRQGKTGEVRIDLAELDAGVYFVSLTDDRNQRWTQRIVKTMP